MSICVEHMEFLLSLNIKWSKIADILVSRSTLYRHMKELDILQFSQLSDHDLDDHIKEIKLEHPDD